MGAPRRAGRGVGDRFRRSSEIGSPGLRLGGRAELSRTGVSHVVTCHGAWGSSSKRGVHCNRSILGRGRNMTLRNPILLVLWDDLEGWMEGWERGSGGGDVMPVYLELIHLLQKKPTQR